MTNKFQQLHGKATILFNSTDIDNLQEVLLGWFGNSLTSEETKNYSQEDRLIQFDYYSKLTHFLRDAHKAVTAA